MNIFFSEEEKHDFLQRKGYDIEFTFEEFERHIHGSRFEPISQPVYAAVKDGKEVNIHVAFHEEFKKILLNL